MDDEARAAALFRLGSYARVCQDHDLQSCSRGLTVRRPELATAATCLSRRVAAAAAETAPVVFELRRRPACHWRFSSFLPFQRGADQTCPRGAFGPAASQSPLPLGSVAFAATLTATFATPFAVPFAARHPTEKAASSAASLAASSSWAAFPCGQRSPQRSVRHVLPSRGLRRERPSPGRNAALSLRRQLARLPAGFWAESRRLPAAPAATTPVVPVVSPAPCGCDYGASSPHGRPARASLSPLACLSRCCWRSCSSTSCWKRSDRACLAASAML